MTDAHTLNALCGLHLKLVPNYAASTALHNPLHELGIDAARIYVTGGVVFYFVDCQAQD